MDKLFRINGFLSYLVVVFLNAFVDLGHKIVIQNTVFKTYDGTAQVVLTALVNGLILLPFVLLFTPAGFLSDKYPKNRIMRISAWVAVGLTGLITIFYYAGWFWPAFAMTFLLAVQSACYSPAKYGYIKESVGKDRLAQANGVVQACTVVAILSGVFIYSILFEQFLGATPYTSEQTILQAIAPIGWVLMGCSVLELFFAYRLPVMSASNQQATLNPRAYLRGQYLKTNLRVLWKSRIIWLSIVGLAVFWAISQVVLAAFPAFAKETLGETNTVVIQGLLACSGIGIMLGSLLAGRASSRYIETGLIPLGALGVVVCLALLPNLGSVWGFGLDFLALGVLGGLFIIPLNALIQFHARDEQLGTVLAGNNWIQNLTMLAFLGLTVACSWLGLDSAGLFYFLTAVALIGAGYTLYRLPQSLVRYMVGLFFSVRYRIQVRGFHHIPAEGPVLLLGNHISWIDWAVIQIAFPRPIRFVMHRNYYRRWYLRWFLDSFKVIPIASGDSKEALAQVRALLQAGEVVCLFPEGALSRTGQVGEFRRGFERAAEGADGIILPFYLHGLWGSRFSLADRDVTDRRTGFRRTIAVFFGQPLPIDAKAPQVKEQVVALAAVQSGDQIDLPNGLADAGCSQ
jgi:acyl-[acyl-carrier-protein]-phospholipid O-acyltransferase/long-chain-fatty-acid--[acyl-carrier-protein] ligase